MGPSGAGKSTLLNALALRLDAGATKQGQARINGQEYEPAHLKQIASYVMQVPSAGARASCAAATSSQPLPPCRMTCSMPFTRSRRQLIMLPG